MSVRKQDNCDECALGKQHAEPIAKVTVSRSTKPLNRVYTDIMGPLEIPSLRGSRYVITFIDDYSRYAVSKFMSTRDQALEKFKEFIAEVGSPTSLSSDNGTQHTSRLSVSSVQIRESGRSSLSLKRLRRMGWQNVLTEH